MTQPPSTPDASGTPEAPEAPDASDTPAPPVLQVIGLSHTYEGQRRRNTVLKEIDLDFERGRFYSILGPSGSGKTTLLGLAGGLDSPTRGSIRFDGTDLARIGLGRYRNRHAATIFQQYNLLTYMSALRNVTTAMEITRRKHPHRRRRALEVLEKVGLDGDTARRNVLQLSGGQQQRVAIARALACDVDVLFADEPTGNLDEDTADGVIGVFKELAHEQRKCVIVVTHSQRVAAESDVVLTLRKGRIATTRGR